MGFYSEVDLELDLAEEWEEEQATGQWLVMEADEPGTLICAVPPIPPQPEPLLPPSVVRHLERLKGDDGI